MTTLRARFDGKVFVPADPVDLPPGASVTLHVESGAQPTDPDPRDALRRIADALDALPDDPDWPVDGAAEHDHYLYGTPKRGRS